MSNIRSIHVLSDSDAQAIRLALNQFMCTPSQIYIDDVPIAKSDTVAAILRKLPQKGISYSVKELAVIRGCFELYKQVLPEGTYSRVLNAIQPVLDGVVDEGTIDRK